MPRSPRPRWSAKRKRWCASIGETGADGRRKEVFAPATLGERDEAGAWEWLRRSIAAREAEVVASTAELTVEWVCGQYLLWARRRQEEGRLPATEFRNKARHLGIVADVLGNRPVRSLAPDDLTSFGETLLAAKFSPTYARNVCATARAALNWAVKAKHLAVNPVRGYKAPTVPRAPARFADRAEAAAFLGYYRTRKKRDSVRGGYERLTILLERVLIRTGARPKELCRLQWGDIHWQGWTTGSGHVAAKAVIPADRWKAGKVTGKPRTVYLTPILTRALRRLWDRGTPDPVWVFVHGGGRGGVGAGEPWRSGSDLSKAILRVRRELIDELEDTRARLKAGEEVEPWLRRRAAAQVRDDGHDRLVNYRWRHTAISTLLMLGVDVPTVAELTGTSPEMIYKHYGHILDGHLERAADALLVRRVAVRSGAKPPPASKKRSTIRGG